MCTCGIDMATQQATPATHSSSCSDKGLMPSGRSDGGAAAAAAGTAALGDDAGPGTGTGIRAGGRRR